MLHAMPLAVAGMESHLECDPLVVKVSSIVAVPLMASLLAAIPPEVAGESSEAPRRDRLLEDADRQQREHRHVHKGSVAGAMKPVREV